MKTIVISGGNDGPGKTIADRLGPNSTVIILSPHQDKLRAAATEIGCEYKVCDVRAWQQVQKVVDEKETNYESTYHRH